MRATHSAVWRLAKVLFLCAAVSRAAAPSELCRILEEHGVTVTTDALSSSVIEGILKAVDPGAQLVEAGQPPASAAPEGVHTEVEWPLGIRYARVDGLGPAAGEAIELWLRAGAGTNVAGSIMDLRGAAGADIGSVDRIAGLFTAPGTPLYEIRNGAGEVVAEHHAVGGDLLPGGVRLVVLVDGATSGASELLAAVLREESGVVLVGSRTKGDAGLRELVGISDTLSVLIATRWTALAGGRRYHAEGIAPDAVVPADGEAVRGLTVAPEHVAGAREPTERALDDRELTRRIADDAALVRATHLLLGMRALGMDGEAVRRSRAGTSKEEPQGADAP